MRHLGSIFIALLLVSCGDPGPAGGGATDGGTSGTSDGGAQGSDAGPGDADGGPIDVCSATSVTADVERHPVDIIWVVDDSSSMQPAIEAVQAGLNDFALLIGEADLDYRVILLSLRGRGPTSVGGSTRYQVCIPRPLSGDDDCGDGPRFFQVEVDIRSTQPLEQLLGTLGQTEGYLEVDSRGSGPWHHLLRDAATKTIVVVTDDNARMMVRDGSDFLADPDGGRETGDPVATADWFESFAGGQNPYNARVLPEGLLHPRWQGAFDGYVFSALYGWGSETDASVVCRYADDSEPPAAGLTYTELVRRTGGVRASLCDGPSAWGPFFGAVAGAVERASRLDCTIAIPDPPEGKFFERDRVNVALDDGTGPQPLPKVETASSCDARGGWHYDDEDLPGAVVLCPTTCESVQPSSGTAWTVDVQFGCATIFH